MKKLKTIVLVLAAALAVSPAGRGQSAPAAEEYAVYAAALREAVGGVSFVVLDTTGLSVRPADLDKALNFPVEHLKLVTADLIADFKSKNRKPSAIAGHFPDGLRVTVIGEKERAGAFGGRSIEGWESFNAKYPGGGGFTVLSRVGFNKAKTAAIVYVGNTRGPESGTWAYFLLVQKDGKWSVVCQTRGRMA
jgi:hypothetical protein